MSSASDTGRSPDVAVVGAGAAGLSAAIAAAEEGASVTLFNTHPSVGLKILMSGGTRCNVTHEEVGPESFFGGSRNGVNLVLKSFPAAAVRRWFEDLGVPLKVEPGGKLFPESDSAGTVLDALVKRAHDLGVRFRSGVRVTAVTGVDDDSFHIETSAAGPFEARAVLLATGGLSFPKTGSDGTGYAIVRSLGHSVVEPIPALTPLVLAGNFHTRLQGVTVPVALTLWSGEKPGVTFAGSLLFTHFGISGPAALDMSRHWLRAETDPARRLTAHFLPGEPRPLAEGGGLLDPRAAEKPGALPERADLESRWLAAAATDPRTTLRSFFAGGLPARLIRELAVEAQVDPALPLPRVTREDRKRFLDYVTRFPVPVIGTSGFVKAEVTAGGVPLEEIDPRRMASRRQSGLFLAGEIVDVDGRLGGYNFQWAWSSGRLAGRSAAKWALGKAPAAE
jgi:predicted flavoprotein YhiN